MMKKIKITLAAAAVFAAGCGANQEIVNSGKTQPTPLASAETKQTSSEQLVRDMQTVDFKYVLVLKRRDGGVFDREDRAYLRENMPAETNRREFSSDDKAFIIGASFRFPPENMKALSDRFIIEDYSKPETKEPDDPAANRANRANRTNKPATNEAGGRQKNAANK
jgi:hypothetical protein